MDISERQQFKDTVVGMYNRAASLYGQVGTRQFTYFANELVGRLPVPVGGHALDIAAGRGALLFALAEKVGEQGHVLGIDLAPMMVAETTAEIQRRGLKHAEMRLMDADALAVASNQFDVATCGFALHFLDFEHTLPKILTALKPGGLFAAMVPYNNPAGADLERWRWLFDLTKAVFPPDFMPPAAWIAPRKLKTLELLTAAFEQAGFVAIQVEPHHATLCFRDEHDWWDWEWSQGSRFWLEGMSAEGLARFKRESFAHLAAMKTAQGIPMEDGALFAVGYKP